MQTQGTTKKKKINWKLWGILGAVVVLVAAGLLIRSLAAKGQTVELSYDDTTILAYSAFEKTVSASGRVESADSNAVYSTAAYPVKEVLVEVGDRVVEGQLLARLDASTVEKQISTQTITLNNTKAGASIQLENAKKNYENFKDGLDQGLNSTLISSETQVQNAYDAYVKAQNAYDRYREGVELGDNSAVLSAESALRSAKTGFDTAFDAYDATRDACADISSAAFQAHRALEDGEKKLADLTQQLEQTPVGSAAYLVLLVEVQVQESTVSGLQSACDQADAACEQADKQRENAETALANASAAYDTAQLSYNAALRTVDASVADAQSAVDTAYRAYQTALSAQAAAVKATGEQLDAYSASVESAQISTNTEAAEEALRQLQAELDKAEIKAPKSGTVTAVYAKVGSTGSGLLFVIEDTDTLIVKTSVKGYDMGSVQLGTPAVVTADAVKGSEFPGTVTKLAPTSNKSIQGTTDVTGDPTFAAEVALDGKAPGLLIGMEAQLDYIVAHEDSVLTVPYDAVYENDSGTPCVLSVTERSSGKWLIRELPVTTGFDNDIDIVVSGTNLEEGLRIINEPEKFIDKIGTEITLGETVKRATIPGMEFLEGF